MSDEPELTPENVGALFGKPEGGEPPEAPEPSRDGATRRAAEQESSRLDEPDPEQTPEQAHDHLLSAIMRPNPEKLRRDAMILGLHGIDVDLEQGEPTGPPSFDGGVRGDPPPAWKPGPLVFDEGDGWKSVELGDD